MMVQVYDSDALSVYDYHEDAIRVAEVRPIYRGHGSNYISLLLKNDEEPVPWSTEGF